MRKWNAGAWLASIVLVLAVSAALAQDIEVYIIQHVDDQPIGELVWGIALIARKKVVVDADVRDRKITLDLDDEFEDALRKIAKAAKAHLWVLDDGSYRIRAKPRPEGAPPEEAPEEAPPVPAWKQAILDKLMAAEIPFHFKGEPLAEVLAKLSKAAGVPIRLDPDIGRTHKAEDLVVNLFTVPLKDPHPVLTTLTAAAGSVKLYWDVRWNGVFVSTQERIESLPKTSLKAAAAESSEKDGKVRGKLAEAKITVALKGISAAGALRRIGRLGGVSVRFNAKDLRGAEEVSLEVEDAPRGDVLDLILVPRGLVMSVAKGAVRITKAE